ncbi:MAG: hypothetical protein AAGH89_17380 [Verrucomicrobiota bacterium]
MAHQLPPRRPTGNGQKFDSLRYSDNEAATPPASVGVPDDMTGLVVELPDSFERPAAPMVPPDAQIPHPAPAPQVVQVKRGFSGFGVFCMAIFAQLLLIGGLGTAAYFYPDEASKVLDKAAQYLNADTENAAPEVVHWTPPEPESTLGARIQILELEDRAIVRGDRTAFSELQRQAKLLESDSANPIYDAVHASLVRVRQLYQVSAQNTPPQLDAQAIFPGAEAEPDLPTASVIQVLRDRRHTAHSRERAAYLLANVNTPPAQKALFNTIQDDPNLQVVVQAFSSFRKSTGYPGHDCFDSEAVESWWYQNAPKILGQN